MALKCKLSQNRTHLKYLVPVLLLAAVVVTRCTVSYSFTGTVIDARIKTISIQYFQNRASLVQVGLSQYLTDAIIDKCKTQTKLSIVNGMGDVNFEGEISGYSTVPLTVAADARAAMNRFTISVKVKFTNSIQPENNYEKVFSRYEDYDSNLELSRVEKDLSDKIITQIVEDIYNEAFGKW
jgi:hypothetical protein